ncbi:MAG TPA: sigma-70 family RNA polymerase sigma factor [Acidimicrobiales bacterium]|nr:sigma-70 family RNA polymerase sigma factor [Acidimicrobiales bacterium]
MAGAAREPSPTTVGGGELRDKFVRFASTRDTGLRAELTEAYLPLAASLAARYSGRAEIEDLEQAANLALVKAVDRFDPSKGFEFTTFAWATIAGELKRHLRDKSWGMRVPRRVQERFLVTARAAEDLHQQLGRPPTVQELSARTGLDEEATIEALEVRALHRLPSLDAPVQGGDGEAIERGAPDAAYDLADDRDLVQRLLGQLPERERELLRLRFAEQLTQSEIAGRIGVSQMHVSRLLTSTLEQLRQMARDQEPSPV